MAKVGKLLGVISSILAIWDMALMLFVPSYSYQSASCRSGYDHQPSSSECSYESGTILAFQVALKEGDHTLFYWSGFVVVVCLIAAVGALAGRAAPIWVCAMSLTGLSIFPLAVVLIASAKLLTVARYESRTH